MYTFVYRTFIKFILFCRGLARNVPIRMDLKNFMIQFHSRIPTFSFTSQPTIIDRCLLLTTKRCVKTWAATVCEFTRLYFTEVWCYFDSIRLFSYILFILRLQFSTRCLARNPRARNPSDCTPLAVFCRGLARNASFLHGIIKCNI